MTELPASREDGYVAILKLKEGELRALSDLESDVKGRMTPLFEMVPSGDEHAPGAHADRRIGRLARVWQMDLPVLMDLHLQLRYDDVGADTAYEVTAEAADDHGVSIVPVVRPRDSFDVVTAATSLVAERDLGSIAIRIRRHDTMLTDLGQVCERILTAARVDPDEAHVIADLEDDINAEDAALLLEHVPEPEEWSSVTLASGAFERPGDYGTQRVSRDGWNIWRELADERRSLARRALTFGDYGTLRAEYQDYSDVPPGAMRVPVRLVYTDERIWLHVSRPYDETRGWDGIYEVCRDIASSPEWYGADYSPGDQAIAERARGDGSTGGPTEWIRWALAHHFTLVTRSLATRSGP